MVSTAGATAETPGTSTAARTSETAESTAATKTTGTSQTETERAATTVKPATVGAQQLVNFHGESRKISIKHQKSMKNAVNSVQSPIFKTFAFIKSDCYSSLIFPNIREKINHLRHSSWYMTLPASP